MQVEVDNEEMLRHNTNDPPGYERHVANRSVVPAQTCTGRVMWEYTYSRFGRPHGPHRVSAATLSEAKDEIRRRHELPDYRGIRVQRSA
jgi:hypothetical protein